MTFSKPPPAIYAAFTVLLMMLGGKIFWPNSFPLETPIQQNWNKLISSFEAMLTWLIANHRPSCGRNSPKMWSSLTSWTPKNFFHGVLGRHGFQCFPPSAKQEKLQNGAEELTCPFSLLPATPFGLSAVQVAAAYRSKLWTPEHRKLLCEGF